MLTKIKVCTLVAAVAVGGVHHWSKKDIPIIETMIEMEARSRGVPTQVALGVARTESSLNPNTVGSAGEIGLFQLKCETARELGFHGPCRNLFEPAVNIYYGIEHLSRAQKRGERAHVGICGWVTLHNAGLHGRMTCGAYGKRVILASYR